MKIIKYTFDVPVVAMVSHIPAKRRMAVNYFTCLHLFQNLAPKRNFNPRAKKKSIKENLKGGFTTGKSMPSGQECRHFRNSRILRPSRILYYGYLTNLPGKELSQGEYPSKRGDVPIGASASQAALQTSC